MCEAGRIRHHLKHNLWREDSTILFVGYQVPGTLGNTLLSGAEKVKLFGEEVEVRAKIVNLPGISGHADLPQLIAWVKAFEHPPKKVFVVHGDEESAVSFADNLTQNHGLDAVAPYSGDVYDLETGMCIQLGSKKFAKKKKTAKATGVFGRLVAAGERLMAVIHKCEGMANKDLAKFADQINSLCDKWDR